MTANSADLQDVGDPSTALGVDGRAPGAHFGHRLCRAVVAKRTPTDLDFRGDLQTEVMRAVWKLGEATVDDVREAPLPRRKSAYNTVQTVLTGWSSECSYWAVPAGDSLGSSDALKADGGCSPRCSGP